jgi:hypothetical protein
MALSAIFEAVKAEHDALQGGVTILNGGEHLGANGAPPRIVWVQTEDVYGPAEIHQDATYLLAEGARPLLQCETTIAVHLWDKTSDDAETLRNVHVSALRHTALAAFKVSRGNWLGPERTIMQGGRVYVLYISFLVPILEVGAGALATVTSTDTGDTAFDPHPGP